MAVTQAREDRDDDECSTLYHGKSKEIRLQRWFIVFVASAVAFGSICELISSARYKDQVVLDPIIMLFLSFSVLVISAVFVVKVYRTKEDEENSSGNIFELIFVLIALVAWSVCMVYSEIKGGQLVASAMGFLLNANLYYSMWFGFIGLLGVLIEFLRTFREIDFLVAIQERGSRFGYWLLMLLASFIMMVSGTSIFSTMRCRHDLEGITLPSDSPITLGDVNIYCNRTALSLGLGAALMGVSLMFVTELWYVKHEPAQLFESEFLFSSLSFAALAVGTGYITSDKGPAARIGNLYYATWLSLLAAATLFFSCFKEFRQKRRERKERTGGGLQL